MRRNVAKIPLNKQDFFFFFITLASYDKIFIAGGKYEIYAES